MDKSVTTLVIQVKVTSCYSPAVSAVSRHTWGDMNSVLSALGCRCGWMGVVDWYQQLHQVLPSGGEGNLKDSRTRSGEQWPWGDRKKWLDQEISRNFSRSKHWYNRKKIKRMCKLKIQHGSTVKYKKSSPVVPETEYCWKDGWAYMHGYIQTLEKWIKYKILIWVQNSNLWSSECWQISRPSQVEIVLMRSMFCYILGPDNKVNRWELQHTS